MANLLTSVMFLSVVGAAWAISLWIGGAFLAAWAASERGRDPLGWWVIAFVFSPLLALLTINALPPLEATAAELDDDEEPALARRAGSSFSSPLAPRLRTAGEPWT